MQGIATRMKFASRKLKSPRRRLVIKMTNATAVEIPGWEFETKERSALATALFPRHAAQPVVFEPTLDTAYLDIERGVRRLVRRLTDYDAETFAQAA